MADRPRPSPTKEWNHKYLERKKQAEEVVHTFHVPEEDVNTDPLTGLEVEAARTFYWLMTVFVAFMIGLYL